MTVPLDRLYHFIENIAETIHKDRVIIYRFFPHGSKNIEDLNFLHEHYSHWPEKTCHLHIWCTDQEPLDYDFYSKNLRNKDKSGFIQVLKSINQYRPHTNLNYYTNWFEKNLLLHSEQRSSNLEKYLQDNELIPVYYWSHALLARDWFRYAEHETFARQPSKLFLIYNRAWSGTREYRLKFCDLIISADLTEQCKINFNAIDPESKTHYANHQFKNACWNPKHSPENFFPSNNAGAASSADFVTEDYEQTSIEVVLETLFDDARLHLTEKSLRPIACGQPFILASPHGSLEYLRSYGFRTFADIWDESYDLEPDHRIRLDMIVDLMREIADWDAYTHAKKMEQAYEIAHYNRQWFFSQDFFDLIVDELQKNFVYALSRLKSCQNYQLWLERWIQLLSWPEVVEFLKNNQDLDSPTFDTVHKLIKLAREKLDQNL